MRRFIHSTLAAACIGSSVSVVVAQPDDPPPMAPPVRPQWDDERPARGITVGLQVPLVPLSRPTAAPSAVDCVPAAVGPQPSLPVAASAAIPGPASTLPPPVPRQRPFTPPVPPAVPAVPPSTIASADLPPVAPAPVNLPEIPMAPWPAQGVRGNPVVEPPTAEPTDKPLPEIPTPAATDKPLPEIPTIEPTRESPSEGSATIEGANPRLPEVPIITEVGHGRPAHLGDWLCDPVQRLFPQHGPVRLRGWINSGGVYNSSVPDSKFNGPYAIVDRSAEPMLNQLYVILDHPLPTTGRFGAGFRVDTLFGSDFYLGQSRGFEVDRDFGLRWNGQYYGLAIPQAYAEWGDDVISLKLGRFYTTVGYEVLPAVGNFFYSRAYSFQFGQPITHWGGLLTTQLTRHWNVHVGLVNGWDTLVGRANNINFLGGLKYQATDWWWTSFALISGQEQNNVANLPNIRGTDGNRTRYSFLFGLLPGGACAKWEYVFHHYYGFQENGTPQGNFARWYGIDQYLYYRVSPSLRAGMRFEWFRDEDGTRVGLNRPANPNKPPLPGNFFSLTTGVNYSPTANFLVRPEIRWDFTTDSARPAFNDGQKNYQLLLGCDVIWQF
ncbi:MAG: outer membrane beta-barrel protein [Gemmataceae bacterium]|nr:outer membrane beta-barrel protein [Gemmata sp.]MDW8198505.1 outer membrane beta-barrel protein [Gemmataceae bacterium]